MEQVDNKNLMGKEPLKKDKKPAGKWPVLSKFLKDVGHFVFDEKSASDELKKDLTALESVRAEERAKAKEAKLVEERKLAEERAKAKVAKHAQELKEIEERAKLKAEKLKAEAEAKKKAEIANQAKKAEIKAKKMSLKTRLANHFKKERESFAERQRTMAEHLLKEKNKPSLPSAPVLKPVAVKPAKPAFNWFKPQKATPLKPIVPPTAPIANSINLPTPPLQEIKNDKNQATNKFKEERLKQQNLSQREQIENRSWQSFGVVHTNLIREQRGMFLNWQSKILWLLLFVAIAGLVSVAAYGFLLILEKDKISSSQGTFANLTGIVAQIQSEEVYAEEILSFNNKLLAVDYLLNNHIYWTNFFKFLDDYTIKDAYYEKFSGDLSGKYVLPAVAKDYRSISNQLRVLQSAVDKVVSVDTGGAASTNKTATPVTGATTATSTSNVKFDLNLNLNRSVFIKEPQYVQ